MVPVIDNPPSSGGSGRANWKRRVDTHVLPHGDIDAFCIIDVANLSVEDREPTCLHVISLLRGHPISLDGAIKIAISTCNT